jgi:hypothetical protein
MVPGRIGVTTISTIYAAPSRESQISTSATCRDNRVAQQGTQRALQRRHQIAWRHHQDREWPCPPGTGGGGLDVSSPGKEDRCVAAARRASAGGGAGYRLEGAKTSVFALQTVGRQRQVEGTSVYSDYRELAGFIWAIGQALPQPVAKA